MSGRAAFFSRLLRLSAHRRACSTRASQRLHAGDWVSGLLFYIGFVEVATRTVTFFSRPPQQTTPDNDNDDDGDSGGIYM